jgi:glycosyltransferase involved in cell wall biosynthesis
MVLEKLRNQRELVIGPARKHPSSLTVFLGLYNAMQYLNSIERQLEEQLTTDYQLLVVDNFSNDGTWVAILTWLSRFGNQVTLVRNPINLGGAGSIELNLDLITTPWVTFIHQDDQYKPQHISRLVLGVSECPKEILAISTQMGSIDEAGRRRGTPPRAQLKMSEYDSINAFILNVQSHAVPWPATAFRTEAYKSNTSSWHNTSFADTEIALKMLLQGKVRNLYSETMKYRENPKSESHTVGKTEGTIGAAVGLIRVFASENFINFSKSLSEDERFDFRKRLLQAIKERVNKNPYQDFVILVAEESMSYSWGYSENDSLTKIANIYSELGSTFTPDLMDRLISFHTHMSRNESTEKQSLQESLNLNSDEKSNISVYRQLYYRFGWLIPFHVRKFVFRKMYGTRI